MKNFRKMLMAASILSLAALGCQNSGESDEDIGPDLVKMTAALGGSTSDAYGSAVAIDGDYAIIGAPRDGSDSRGAAWIYHRTGQNVWDEGAKLVAYDAAANDYFGSSVAIDGDYAIVGAASQDSSAGAGTVADAGAAYIFRRTAANAWVLSAKLIADYPAAGDNFGNSVSISGDYAGIAAQFKDEVGFENAGAVYVFHRTASDAWDFEARLAPTDLAAQNRFGIGVGISGDYLIAGTLYNFTGGPQGRAYVFHRASPGSWVQDAILAAPDGGAADRFGISVAIDGDRAIVGADNADGASKGAAYAFSRGASGWDAGTRIEAYDAAAGDAFGTSVAIKGAKAIVGAIYKKDGVGDARGCAYVFRLTGAAWVLENQFMVADSEKGARFGASVAIDGDYALAGAPYGAAAGAGYFTFIK